MKPNSYNPRVELLEDRTLMSTCHVTRLTDMGVGKGFRGDLRYCINKVNAEPGPDAIDFTVTGTISLNSALPNLASDIDIQGPGKDVLAVQGQGAVGGYRIFTIMPGVTVQFSGLSIRNGDADTGGAVWNAGNLTIDQCQIMDSSARREGGGIYNEGVLVIQASVVSGHSMRLYLPGFSYGSGIHNNGGQLTIIHSVIRENENINEFARGTISNLGELTVIASSIASNLAWGYFKCEGIGIYNSGTAAIYDTAITNNVAEGLWGGAIHNDEQGFISVSNSTISRNQGWDGIAVHLDGGTAIISHSTITENDGDGHFPAGGILIEGSAQLFMRNTIVAGNYGWDVHGLVTSSGYNLIGNSDGGEGFAPTDILDVNPLLGPLADNGGPTLTIALLPGSPAIDAGDNTDAPEWDQRGPGFPRIVNGTIDIGAFEVQASPTPSSGGVGRPVLSANQWSADLPRSGFITQPRVAERTLGMQTDPTPTLKGLHLDDAIQPLRGISMVAISNPGCAARPWAVICNPFGVSEDVMLEVDMPA